MPMADRTFAIVVTFHPGEPVASNLQALRREGLRVIVVDNGSSESELAPIESLADVLIRNGRNLGVATALNIGVAAARERRADWIFTFDQDSRVQPGFAGELVEAWRTAEGRGLRVGLVSPRYRDQRSGLMISAPAAGPFTLLRDTMTSGNLLKPSTFDVVGGYADDYFIDSVDTEFCLRCRARGLAIVQANATTLDHNLGELRWYGPVAGRRLAVCEQSPTRRYYMMRNRLRTYARFGAKEPAWLIRELRRVAFEEVKMLLFERQRLRKLRFQARGIVDALRGRTGPL